MNRVRLAMKEGKVSEESMANRETEVDIAGHFCLLLLNNEK